MEICKECVHFDEDERPSVYSSEGYCMWYRKYYYGGCTACSNFKSRYYDTSSTGCYITTMVHDILGEKDNSETLEVLREFRNDVLQKNKKYESILYEYDSEGPIVAKRMKEDNDYHLVEKLYEEKLVPIREQIKNKNYLGAIVNYLNLTTELKIYYGVKDIELDNNYDYTKGGHGKVYKK